MTENNPNYDFDLHTAFYDIYNETLQERALLKSVCLFTNKSGIAECDFINFRQLNKIWKSYYELRHVCLPVGMEQLCSHWTNFHEIGYLTIFRKSIKKIHLSLKSDINNKYFT